MRLGRAITGALVLGLGAVGYGLKRADARAGPATLPAVSDSGTVRLVQVASGLESPVHLAAPAGDARLFIVEQAGRIRILKDGRLLPQPFLDITRRVGSGGERGLLSLAFHPDYRTNGRFFVDYTDRHGDTHVAEFHATPAADTAESGSERQLLLVQQPHANHNGGQVAFGPDGALYVGMGDGGAQGDPHGNGQSPTTMLGKLLRITVDATRPQVSRWATGLRNPWRFSFDSGLVYIADVGQWTWEEIDVAPASDSGLNYGWRTMEGAHCFVNPVCDKQGLVLPAAEYEHAHGCSVIGGGVYRGRAAPALVGQYLYSDYCTGWLRSFSYQNGVATNHRTWTIPDIGSISSFGVDGAGEMYMISHTGGAVYRITAQQ